MWKDIAKYDCQNDTQNIYKIVHIHTRQRAKGYKHTLQKANPNG